MTQEKDPGFGERFLEQSKRVINPDGTFNVRRIGVDDIFRSSFHFLRNTTWIKFNTIVVVIYLLINAVFALLYLTIGVENIHNAQTGSWLKEFEYAFYFSVQTFTTVGYGVLAPKSGIISFVAAIEALSGFMGFALATGLLYGRFSRPAAKLLFSKKAIISNHKGRNALMFRVVNKRNLILMELNAKVMVKIEEVDENGQWKRSFKQLKLENSAIHFFPMNWTLVHVIDVESPLWNMDENDMKSKKLEIVGLIKAYDESYAQNVHARFSYTYDEIEVGGKYNRIFETDESGEVLVYVNRIHEFENEELQKPLKTQRE